MDLSAFFATRCSFGRASALRSTAFVSCELRRAKRRLRGGVPWLLAAAFFGNTAFASTLTVDLSAPIRPVTHAASGSLYGVTETKPADVTGLIGPLHPNVFTNPASDVQQPVGDAIVVAGRLAPVGGKVMIRLADWFPGFYTFSSMTDWFDKIGKTVTRKKASGVTNYYGYEIWNEPGGTYKGPLAFNEFWKQSYDKLRELDPEAKIIGPSTSFYDSNTISSLLTYCKTNSCLPDIMCWHELSGSNLTANLTNYRALEKQLGVGPLPISINEYSGNGRASDEGKPGTSAPLIAKFERFQVDSACISYWDVPHPGRLGTLLASDTTRNGGWWFYKWYGDMTGNMVTTTPPTPSSPTALDGFASVDAATHSAHVLLGGTNDGSVQVVIKGFQAGPFWGTSVHAVVERTPWVNGSTEVKATTQVSAADYMVATDQITVPIASTNASDGYHVYLTPLGGAVAAGGAGGAGGSGGAGTAGAATNGGAPPSGGASMGGAPAAGGAVMVAGSDGAGLAGGGASGGAAPGAGSSGMSNAPSAPANSDSGCGCEVAGRSRGAGASLAFALGLLFAFSRRRKGKRAD
jgi:hypothetical protein